jgi:hypothetical protein
MALKQVARRSPELACEHLKRHLQSARANGYYAPLIGEAPEDAVTLDTQLRWLCVFAVTAMIVFLPVIEALARPGLDQP